MTARRLLPACVLGLAGLGILAAPAATAAVPSAMNVSAGRVACAWLLDEGVCISNPGVPRLPSVPSVP